MITALCMQESKWRWWKRRSRLKHCAVAVRTPWERGPSFPAFLRPSCGQYACSSRLEDIPLSRGRSGLSQSRAKWGYMGGSPLCAFVKGKPVRKILCAQERLKKIFFTRPKNKRIFSNANVWGKGKIFLN